MTNTDKNDFLDYLIILVKWKVFLIITAVVTVVAVYLSIYFMVDEQFDASALIIPSEESSLGGLAGLIGGFGNDLPLGFGGMSNPEMNMYNTIIYSRTNLDKVITKFQLIDFYELDKSNPNYKNIARETLANNISAAETENAAYEISVRTTSPQLSADITNFIVAELNEKIIELRTQQSKNNREFLEERLNEVSYNLEASEDSLLKFQQKSGILDPEQQFGGIYSAFSRLEAELIAKQIEKSTIEEIRGKDSPQYQALELQVNQIQKKLNELKSQGGSGGVLPSITSLPKSGISYLRLFRDIEINSRIMEFMLPLYEQAKVDEKKDIPTLQVIDYAIPPTKKSYPPRLIFTLIITFGIMIVVYFILLLRENEKIANSPKLIYIRENIFRFRNRT